MISSITHPPSIGLPPEKLAPHAIARWARETPATVALQYIDGPSFTYAELDRGVKRWAAAYRRAGVAKGDHVATFLPTGPDAIFAWLGLAWLGAIEVPLNVGLVGELLRHRITHSDAKAIVVAQSFLPRLEALGPVGKLKTVVVIDGARTTGRDLLSRCS